MPSTHAQAYTSNFDALGYIKARPRYQSVVLDLIKSWHQSSGSNAQFNRCLDVGCGPGILSYPLATMFKHVVGLDPSPMMLQAARTNAVPEALGIEVPEGHTVEFVEGSIGPDSEGKFNQLESGSFDFILAATAIHWVDWKSDPKGEKVWREFGRLLKPGGSVFFTGYGTDTILGHPTIDSGALRLLNDPETGLGKYFDQESPLSVTRLGLNLYSTLPTPTSANGFAEDQTRLVLFDAEERLKTVEDARDVKEVNEGGHLFVVRSKKDKDLPEWIKKPLLAHNSDENDACRLVAHGSQGEGGKQRSVTTLNDLAKYYHSASAWPRYLDDHPEEKELQKEGKDFIMTGLEKIRQEDAKERGTKPVEWDEPMDVLSPVTVFVARKKLE